MFRPGDPLLSGVLPRLVLALFLAGLLWAGYLGIAG